jgi:hypothetical protein
MKALQIAVIAALAVCLVSAANVKIEKGWLTLDIATGDAREERKVEYNGHLKEVLTLTQSSKITIKAKVHFPLARSPSPPKDSSPNCSPSGSGTPSTKTSPNPFWLPGTRKVDTSAQWSIWATPYFFSNSETDQAHVG